MIYAFEARHKTKRLAVYVASLLETCSSCLPPSPVYSERSRGQCRSLPLIPRKRVVCAMRLLSPLAGKWDAGRSAYRKAKLEEMAQAMGAAFPDAHDAAADVKMTIAVLRWAYSEAHKRARA